jgi:hypothetical protein
MRDRLRTFAAVPLALAACCTAPANPSGDGAGALEVRLCAEPQPPHTADRSPAFHRASGSCSVRLKVLSRTALAHSPRYDDSKLHALVRVVSPNTQRLPA